MKKIITALLLTTLIATTFFVSCKKDSQETQEVKKSYTFASDATWPPLEFVEDGVLTGFEIELIPLIGEAVGVEMVAKNIPWDTIFAGLANGAYDGVASGVTVTEERKNIMAFSTPILNAGQVIIIQTSSKDSIKGIEDLEGKKIGVQIGTTGDFALDNFDVVKKQYDDIGLAIQDMLNSNIEAAVCDSLIASDFVLANKNYQGKLVIVGEKFTEEDIAIAVQKDNVELLNLINKGLAILQENGTYDELKAKWNLL